MSGMAKADAAPRTRTVDWQDPAISAKAAQGLSGIEFLQKIVSGEIPTPPIAVLLGFRLVNVGPGEAQFEIEPAEYHYNPIGVVHGGIAATLLDSAMGCAVQSLQPAGAGYTTLEIKINLVRAITFNTGLLRADAKVVHSGSRIATAEGRLLDRAGKIYAHGSTTCLILAARG